MKKLLSLLLVFVFVLGITACGKKGNEKETGTQGGYSSNTESEYEDTVSEWQGEGESDGEFDNTGGEQAPATPGSESQTVVLNNPVADNKDGQAATDSFPSLDERNFQIQECIPIFQFQKGTSSAKKPGLTRSSKIFAKTSTTTRRL